MMSCKVFIGFGESTDQRDALGITKSFHAEYQIILEKSYIHETPQNTMTECNVQSINKN